MLFIRINICLRMIELFDIWKDFVQITFAKISSIFHVYL